MKVLSYILVFVLMFQFVVAQPSNKVFPHLKKSDVPTLSKTGGLVTYVKFSNSVNGPFSSPKTILTTDSLFIQVDVAPLGSVTTSYYMDMNENGTVESWEPYFGSDVLADNSGNDRDPTSGIIVYYLNPENPPSMTVIVKAVEGVTEVQGILTFQNPPAAFTLSGTIYNPQGEVIPAAWVFASTASSSTGDVADFNGIYSLPLNTGTYSIHVEDMSGVYTSFDTMLTIVGNTTQNFYLKSLTSYIKGYVRDNLGNPIPNIGVYVENTGGGDVFTDSNGKYIKFVSAGSGRIGLSSSDLQPTYMSPNSHDYTIGENDSIVNNSTSNFTCYRTNATITGTLKVNGSLPAKSYLIHAWGDYIQSSSHANTDPANGNYSLPVYSSTFPQTTYGISVADWSDEYPLPSGMYVDTSYWGILPSASNINFNLVSAETSCVEPFLGNDTQPSDIWNNYYYNQTWGQYGTIKCLNDRLIIITHSQSGSSASGVKTKKPFQLTNREFKILMDHSELGTNNSAHILLSGRSIWNHPTQEDNWIKLGYSKRSGAGGWKLEQSKDRNISTLWQSSELTGGYILFQFNEDASILTLKINGVVKYSGPWGQQFSIAYFNLFQFNDYPDVPTPIYFDEFFVGATGSTGVREIAGELPQAFNLEQNYPNPFNPKTTIKFQLPVSSTVSLKVYNVLGQEVADLINGEMNAGTFEAAFDASKLSSGIYYYKLTAVDTKTGQLLMNSSRKAILLK